VNQVLVVGSVALDTVETPFGRVDEALGGSAVYFSLAASLYAPVGLVGVVGSDFPASHVELLQRRGVDVSGLASQAGRTFRWSGRYDYDLNTTETLDTQLNVFAQFQPSLPPAYRRCPYLFLANIDPGLQASVLAQMDRPTLTMADTMNYWIQGSRDALIEVLRRVDVVTMNESEARLLTQTYSLARAAREILNLGPRAVIVKRGEYGAVVFADTSYFVAPALLLEEVKDPTGAGDSFAGGVMGYLARTGDLSPASLRRAVIHGSAVASFTVGEFSVDGLTDLSLDQVEERYHQFRAITEFELAPQGGQL